MVGEIKKRMICVVAIASMLCASSAFAATYDSENKSVTTDTASDKMTVMIVQGDATIPATEGNIVYINQANDTFGAAANFIINGGVEDGAYTVYMNSMGGKTAAKETFYVGMNEAAGDWEMSEIGRDEVSDDSKTYYNIGYKATLPIDNYKSIIVKTTDGTYSGYSLPITLNGEGVAVLGVLIKGVPNNTIDKVYISTRSVDTSSGTVSE